MQAFTFHLPVKTVFGAKSVRNLEKCIPQVVKNIVVVTDRNLIGNDTVSKIIQNLETRFNVGIYAEIEENPSFETIDHGGVYAKSAGCDLVIGLGGGSSMDAAKGIAITATNPDSIRVYVKGKEPERLPLPVICIPTTSGTGSEVTPFAVFTDKVNQEKCGYAHESIFPIAAIIDPELSYSMPMKTLVSSGLDVLSHAVEAYCSNLSFPHCDLHALKAIQLVLENLRKAAQKDPIAMQKMSYASMLAGVAIAHASTILPHIMGYPLTVYHSIPHGLASFLTLPAFLKFLRKNHLIESKLNELEKNIKGLDQFETLAKDLGISLNLRAYGIQQDQFEPFAEKALLKADIQITPGNIVKNDIISIYRAAF